jgi:hypothetical protein
MLNDGGRTWHILLLDNMIRPNARASEPCRDAKAVAVPGNQLLPLPHLDPLAGEYRDEFGRIGYGGSPPTPRPHLSRRYAGAEFYALAVSIAENLWLRWFRVAR